MLSHPQRRNQYPGVKERAGPPHHMEDIEHDLSDIGAPVVRRTTRSRYRCIIRVPIVREPPSTERLRISPKTVGHHVQHIYGKMGISTRAALAVLALERGLLQD